MIRQPLNHTNPEPREGKKLNQIQKYAYLSVKLNFSTIFLLNCNPVTLEFLQMRKTELALNTILGF